MGSHGTYARPVIAPGTSSCPVRRRWTSCGRRRDRSPVASRTPNSRRSTSPSCRSAAQPVARRVESLVSAPTVARYVDLLVDLLLLRRLRAWSGNLGKRLVRSPKTYVRDSGLLHALLEIEIKRTTAPDVSKGFRLGCDSLRPQAAYVLHSGSEEWPLRDRVTAIGAIPDSVPTPPLPAASGVDPAATS